MVPVMEVILEIILLRYVTDSDFTKFAYRIIFLGVIFASSCSIWFSTFEWLVAIICACAYAPLLRQTRSVFACIVAHAVTNLALGVYVILLMTGFTGEPTALVMGVIKC